jgi:hypothetical protein
VLCDLGIQPHLLCHPFSSVHVASRTVRLLRRLLDLGTRREAVSIALGLYLKEQLAQSKTMDGYVERTYHDLHPDTLTANIIEHKFGTRGSLIVYPPGSLNLYIPAGFSGLEATVRSNKISEIGIDVEFMRVRGGILRFAKLVDVP